jgi:hypothetical protein
VPPTPPERKRISALEVEEEGEEEEECRRGEEEPVLFCQRVVLVSGSSVVEGKEEGVEKKGMGKRKEREESRPKTGRRSCVCVEWEGGRGGRE